ncbi:ribonuclease BN [Pseudonocardia sp. CNS-004]|nr:ribonuclease BN [Pseudonocardia sp. CNS-004]
MRDPARPGRAGAAREPSPFRRVIVRLLSRAWDDDVLSQSASAAFWQTLSVPPLLLGLFGLLGYAERWFGPDTVVAVQEWIVQTTSGVFSSGAVDEIIAPTVAEILTTARGEVVSIGFVLSFWSGSSAMSAFVDAITRAHDQFPVRWWVWQRILAILLYLAGLVVGIVLLPVAALGPDRLFPLLPASIEPAARAVVDVVYLPVVVVVLVLALTSLYKIALPFKPPWYRGLPGAVLAAVVFLVGATGLRLYLDWVTSTGYTYGALAAPIAFLLGIYFIALAVILGAHFNAAIQTVRPARLRRRGRLVDAPDVDQPRASRP